MYTQIAEVDRRADTRAIRQSWRRNSQDFSSIVPSGECRGCNQCELDVFADGNYDMLLSIVCDIYPLMKMSESLRRQPGKRRSRGRDVSNWLFSINDSQILDTPASSRSPRYHHGVFPFASVLRASPSNLRNQSRRASLGHPGRCLSVRLCLGCSHRRQKRRAGELPGIQ